MTDEEARELVAAAVELVHRHDAGEVLSTEQIHFIHAVLDPALSQWMDAQAAAGLAEIESFLGLDGS